MKKRQKYQLVDMKRLFPIVMSTKQTLSPAMNSLISSTKLLVLVLCTFLTLSTKGQIYEPTILILSSYETTADQSLKKEIDDFNEFLRKNQKQNKREINQILKEIKDEPENIKVMYQKQIEFSKDPDFYSVISSITEGYLQYRFFERFKNILIYATKEKSIGTIEQLKVIADEKKMQYIINFPKVNSFVENNSKKTIIRVQLYDNYQKKIVLDKKFTGEDRNPGFEFACEDGSLSCTINNSLSQALREITSIVAINNPTIIRERELAKERASTLFSKYYPKKKDEDIIDIIEKIDTSISTKGFYHGFMNESKTKFIGFFALNSRVTNFKELQKENDKNVQILSDDIYNLDSLPTIYANVVIGIKFHSNWYLKKDKVTYFNAEDFETGKKKFFNNLQHWNFFKENSSQFNPDFWETYFYEKVKDVSKEPDYEEYYESIYKSEEERNRGYIGMYEIVADQLRKEQSRQNEKFEETVGEQILRPFFDQLKINQPVEFSNYFLMYEKFTLIFPRDKSLVLNPLKVENGKGQIQLRYFVVFLDTKEFYEWTYLKPKTLNAKTRHYGSEIVDQISTLTDWDFSIETLDDKKFWEHYLLKKNGGKYQYLKKLD